MKALLGTFNQEKAFSVIVKTDGSFAALLLSQAAWLAAVTRTEHSGWQSTVHRTKYLRYIYPDQDGHPIAESWKVHYVPSFLCTEAKDMV